VGSVAKHGTAYVNWQLLPAELVKLQHMSSNEHVAIELSQQLVLVPL
jgi:hypothetical protein